MVKHLYENTFMQNFQFFLQEMSHRHSFAREWISLAHREFLLCKHRKLQHWACCKAGIDIESRKTMPQTYEYNHDMSWYYGSKHADKTAPAQHLWCSGCCCLVCFCVLFEACEQPLDIIQFLLLTILLPTPSARTLCTFPHASCFGTAPPQDCDLQPEGGILW